MMKRMMAILAAVLATAAAAQSGGSDGERFLEAIRAGDDGKAAELIASRGPSVVQYRGSNGDTPLTVAATKRNATYVSFLLGKGADPDLGDRRGDTALIIAARSGFQEGLEQLISAGADVNAANRQGETALIVAVQGRHDRAVRRLLQAGADADKTDIAAGYSARDYAKRDTRARELLRLIETVKPANRSLVGPTRN